MWSAAPLGVVLRPHDGIPCQDSRWFLSTSAPFLLRFMNPVFQWVWMRDLLTACQGCWQLWALTFGNDAHFVLKIGALTFKCGALTKRLDSEPTFEVLTGLLRVIRASYHAISFRKGMDEVPFYHYPAI